jgi:chemotaxis protein methyltransferase WspC
MRRAPVVEIATNAHDAKPLEAAPSSQRWRRAQRRRPPTVAKTAPRLAPERSAAPRPCTREAVARAIRLADEGRDAAALEVAAALVAEGSGSPDVYLLKGQIALSRGDADAAIEDMRRALFLAPGHRVARHWYVIALQAAGRIQSALSQARVLEDLLERSAGDDLLEDEQTTARQLLQAVRFLRGGLT